MAAAQAAENHGDKVRFDLIFIMRDKYINFNLNPLTKFTTSRTTESEFPNGGKAIAEQIIASEERNKFKRAGL